MRPAPDRGGPRWSSGGGDVDVDVCAVGQDVVDGRPAAGLLDDLAKDGVGCVAFDREVDTHLAVAVAHVVRQSEDAVEVDVALDRRLDAVQVDAARGRDVGDAGGQ